MWSYGLYTYVGVGLKRIFVGSMLRQMIRWASVGPIYDTNKKEISTEEICPFRVIRGKAVHPKQNACLKASLEIVPPQGRVKVGLFEHHKTYEAWARFSNSIDTDDTKKGQQGLAIKILVEDRCHDLTFSTDSVLFTNSSEDYLSVMKFQKGCPFRKAVAFLKNPKGILGAIRRVKAREVFYRDPMHLHWNSVGVYRYGPNNRIKYLLKPTLESLGRIATQKDDISKMIANHKQEVRFDLYLQFDTSGRDPNLLTEEWKGEPTEFAGTLTLYPGDYPELGEKLAFNPSTLAFPGHEPLGELNCLRGPVYREGVKNRRLENWGVSTDDPLWPLNEENA